eukprot:Seg904.2 transcript_id=Seg904.2/GoldUCD/mRNA.D3Y31 product="Nuclear nucleic acid-binding protein C1D" protein_id=Seg904.2/GoldUCD/D3Y31
MTLMNGHNHYEVLGVEKDAPIVDIKMQYRKLILENHPDKQLQNGQIATKRFHEIENAWKILSDPQKRQEYDAYLKEDEIGQCAPFDLEIDLPEMDFHQETSTYTIECRCGGEYIITREQLEEGYNVVPYLVESMENLDRSFEKCQSVLKRLMKVPLLDSKDKLEPIEKAKLDLSTTYAMNSLFWIYLVSQGVNATDHPVKGELDRIRKYMSKVKITEEKVKGASLKIDKEAAKRFVKSALWEEKEKSKKEDNTETRTVDEGKEQTERDNAEEDASPGKLSHQLKINKQAIKNKLQGLDHDLRFKWTLKPADIEQLSRQGIQFEEGIWTKDEIEILESNMTEFCDTAGMSLQDLKDLLLDKSSTVRKIKKELGVYTILTVGLNRNIFSVYKKIVKYMDPCGHKGKWSVEEESNLLELYRKYGCRWQKIGSEIGRSGHVVGLKLNDLLNGDLHKGFDNVVPSIQGPWETDEEDRLLKVVKQLSTKTECNGDEECGKEKPICWVTVATHVKTRTSQQCRKKWVFDLSWKKPGQKIRKWSNEDFAKFLTLLNDCGEKYDKHVDWVKIGKDLGKPESGVVLRRKWTQLRAQVPGYKLLEFQEILDWLMKNKVPKLLGR